MNRTCRFAITCIVLALASLTLASDKPIAPDLSQINDPKIFKLINAQVKTATEDGKAVLHLDPIGGNINGKSNDAFALLEGVNFTEGTIDVDLKGNGANAGSFLGIAFNVSDADHFEAIYFRAFSFAPDRDPDHAIQYVALPDYSWKKLRADKPGVYEAKANPAPDPAGWFHARFDITDKKVSVFVNDAKAPSLVVDRLSAQKSGNVGLFVDSKTGAFRDLKVTSK